MSDLVLVGCTVVDGTERPPRPDAGLWIRDGRIEAVGAADDLLVESSGAEIVDLGGAFVAPGLMNMHVHFSLILPGEEGRRLGSESAAALALRMAASARATLESGVTTVRLVAEKDHADFALRDAIRRGQVPGPRILTAGQGLACTGGHGHESRSVIECDGVAGFRQAARAQIRAGADLIKVMLSGGIAGEYEGMDTSQLARDELEAITGVAHAWGRKVTAHAGPAGVIREGVEAGLDCVEHGYLLTEDVAQLMAERGTWLVPTMLVTRCGEFFDRIGAPDWMVERALGAGPRHLESLQLAIAAGVHIALGSDMPPAEPFEGTTATVRELEHLADAGLGPAGALRSATAKPAEWLGIADEVGTLEPGKAADLVALAADPSQDAAAFRSLWFVMQAGRVVRDDHGVTRVGT